MFNLFPVIPVILLLLYPLIFNSVSVSSIMYLLINAVSFCIFLYSTWYMKEDKKRVLFMVYLTVFSLFMNLLTVARDYITFFIGWEGVGLTSFLLIGFWFEDKENMRKAKQAFLLTKLTDIGYIIGAAYLIYHNTNFMSFENTKNIPLSIRLLMFLPCVGKSALFPLFIWLPNAMAAPTPVSAHLHSATMVAAGVFYVTKFQFFFYPLFNNNTINYNMTYLILAGYFIVSFLALIESDIKRLLAYSTVSHLSLMYLGFLCGQLYHSENYIPFTHMILHAFTKAPLFLIAGFLIHKYHSQDLNKLRGVLYNEGILKLIFLILILSLSGFIFIGTFWSKFVILVALENKFHSEIFSSAITILSASYCARFYFILTRKFSGQTESHPVSKTPIIAITILFIFLISLTLYIAITSFLPTKLAINPYKIELLQPLILEFILIIFVFTVTYFLLTPLEKIICAVRKLKKYIVLEKIYYSMFQIPAQFIQFLCRTQVEELWDEFINKFVSAELTKFIYDTYKVFYNGIVYNYLIIILVSTFVFFLIYLGYALP